MRMENLEQTKRLIFEKTGTLNRKNEYFYINENTVELIITRKKQHEKLSILLNNDEGLLSELQKTFWNYKSGVSGKNRMNEFCVYNDDAGSGTLKKDIYKYFLKDCEELKIVYTKTFDGIVYNYKIDNLTINFRESSSFEDGYMKNMREHAGKTINRFVEENLAKRAIGPEYSRVQSQAKKKLTREKSKLNLELVEEIRKDYHEAGISQTVLSEMYGVSRTLIADIVNYRIWNEHEITQGDIVVEPDVKEIEMIEYVKGDEFNFKPFDIKQVKIGQYIYSFKQVVDDQYYMSRHNEEGEFLSDVHLYLIEGIKGFSYKNFLICKVRGSKHIGVKMTKNDVYNILWSIHCAVTLANK